MSSRRHRKLKAIESDLLTMLGEIDADIENMTEAPYKRAGG